MLGVLRTRLRRYGTMIPMSIWRASRTSRRDSPWSDLHNAISETRRYGTWSNFLLPRTSGATDSDEPWPVTYGINIQAIGSYACTRAIRRPCGFGRERSRTIRVGPIVKTYAAFLAMHGRTSHLRHLTIVAGDRERQVVTRRGRGRDCAPRRLIGRFCAAPRLHR